MRIPYYDTKEPLTDCRLIIDLDVDYFLRLSQWLVPGAIASVTAKGITKGPIFFPPNKTEVL